MTGETTGVGKLGEAVASNFLCEHGYEIINTNFQRRSGEIDIIATRDELVFVEVKTVRCRIPQELPQDGGNNFRPEENVDDRKRKRLRRVIQIYLENEAKSEIIWRCDLLCVYIDPQQEIARVKWLKNIII